jgi:cytochrome P450
MNHAEHQARVNPYPTYAHMRNASPISYNPQANVWTFFRYEDVKVGMFDKERFSSDVFRYAPESIMSRSANPSLLFTDPPKHTQLRSLVAKAFTPKSIAEMEPRIREITHSLLDRMIENGQGKAELMDEFCVQLPTRLIADMLGIPGENYRIFKAWSDERVAGAGAVQQGRLPEKPLDAVVRGMLAEQIKKYRAQPGDNLISRLLDARIDGEALEPDELRDFCALLLVGGNESTTNLIGNMVWTLLEHPDELARLRTQPELIPSLIEEVLRYRAPFQMFVRCASRDFEYKGHQLQKGQIVMVMIGSANRDEGVFAEPDRFDITRKENPHLGFGTGSHFCLGAPLAMLEARVALESLFSRLSDFAWGSNEPLVPSMGYPMALGLGSLPFRFTPATAHS